MAGRRLDGNRRCRPGPGDSVKSGDTLLVIEAMKMKNAIRASQDGKVAAVHIGSGQTVQHKQLLVEFE